MALARDGDWADETRERIRGADAFDGMDWGSGTGLTFALSASDCDADGGLVLDSCP